MLTDVTPVDLSRAHDGKRIGGREPIAVEGWSYGLITVLDRLEPDIRDDTVPARYHCRAPTKIVQRSIVGRRWYFHNGVCVVFFRASAEAAGVRA